MTFDFSLIGALTFDCYGTLIDWEAGILRAVRRFAPDAPPARILEAYGRLEAAAESGTYRPYRVVLHDVLAGLSRELGFAIPPGREDALAQSLGSWEAFPDTPGALHALKERFRLCICSNIDRELFACSESKLGVEFDAVVTAEDVGSYKPAPGHWKWAMDVLDLPANHILHVAQSLYHDIRPARDLGFATAWVNRKGGTIGVTGVDARPDVEVPDLQSLAQLATGTR